MRVSCVFPPQMNRWKPFWADFSLAAASSSLHLGNFHSAHCAQNTGKYFRKVFIKEQLRTKVTCIATEHRMKMFLQRVHVQKNAVYFFTACSTCSWPSRSQEETHVLAVPPCGFFYNLQINNTKHTKKRPEWCICLTLKKTPSGAIKIGIGLGTNVQHFRVHASEVLILPGCDPNKLGLVGVMSGPSQDSRCPTLPALVITWSHTPLCISLWARTVHIFFP
jgi:hypothetical protein